MSFKSNSITTGLECSINNVNVWKKINTHPMFKSISFDFILKTVGGLPLDAYETLAVHKILSHTASRIEKKCVSIAI